jgi:hypothetical protein
VIANRVDWAAGVIGLPKRAMGFRWGKDNPLTVNFTTQKTIRDRKHERIVEKSAIGWNLAIKEIKP